MKKVKFSVLVMIGIIAFAWVKLVLPQYTGGPDNLNATIFFGGIVVITLMVFSVIIAASAKVKAVKCTFAHNDFFIRNNNLYCKQCGCTVNRGKADFGKQYLAIN